MSERDDPTKGGPGASSGNSSQRDAKRIRRAQRTARAAELRVQGMTNEQIAEELGLAHRSNVSKLIRGYVEEHPAANVEELRVILTQRLERVHKRAAKDAEEHEDERARDRAQRVVIRAAEVIARINGVVQAAPLVEVKLPGPPPSEGPDLSKLSPAELNVVRLVQQVLGGVRPTLPMIQAAMGAWCAENAPPLPEPVALLPPAPAHTTLDGFFDEDGFDAT